MGFWEVTAAMTKDTRIFRLQRGLLVSCGIVVLAFGAASLGLAVAGPLTGWSSPVVGVRGAGDEVKVVGLGLACLWLGIRLLRAGVQIRGGKLTVRGYFRTRAVNASEIRAITLQPKQISQGGPVWIPRVDLADGTSIWINSFECGPAARPPKPTRVATVDEVRKLLGMHSPVALPDLLSEFPGTAIAGQRTGAVGRAGQEWVDEVETVPAPSADAGSPRTRARARQVVAALMPIVSLTVLSWVPFLWLALSRRRRLDWAVFTAYLLAPVAAIILFLVASRGIIIGGVVGAVIVWLVVLIAPVHALLAFRPGAAVPSWRDALAARETAKQPSSASTAVSGID